MAHECEGCSECKRKDIIRQARNEALEEAARVTDPKEPCGRTDYEKQAYGLRLVIAGAIRSLKAEAWAS